MRKQFNRIRLTYQHIAFCSALLALFTLFIPFVWLEIGPEGYEYYGPTVPHVYIYGGAITGKDLSWTPIAIAMIFQLVCILVFALLAFLTRSSRFKPLPVLLLQSFLLLLFPLWINFYVDGVIGNSDCADMIVHWQQPGMYVYGVLVVLNVVAIVKVVWKGLSEA